MDIDLAALDQAGAEYLPGLLGIEFDGFEDGVMHAHLALNKSLFAPNGYVHAGAIVTLADTACGYGCILTLPEDATGFTTIELKTNFLRSQKKGRSSARRTSYTAAAQRSSGTRPSVTRKAARWPSSAAPNSSSIQKRAKAGGP